MKITFTFLISGLLVSGCCSQKPITSASPAIDLIQSGTDTTWNSGQYVLHVTKRDGNSLEGIKLVTRGEWIFTAERGSVSTGSVDGASDNTIAELKLYNVTRTGHGRVDTGMDVSFPLHR